MNKKIVLSSACALLGLAGLVVYLNASPTFTPSAQPVGYVPQIAVDGYDISTGLQNAWRVDYSRADWSGDIDAVDIPQDGVIDNNSPFWTRAVFDAQNFDTGRKIFTRNASTGVAFRYAASPSGTTMSAAQHTSINATQATQQKIINYVRGEKTNEKPSGSQFRARTTSLGAIIHSTPIYFDDGTNKRVYVGANDGMLHAFNALTGSEVFAYIPSFLIPNLDALTDATSPYPLTYFVDGNHAIARDIDFSGTPKNILVGGVGAGGKGIYALDITSSAPATETVAATMSLWEVTSSSSGFTNLGYTYGTPQFAVLSNGSDAVLVNNGYASSSGAASLFVINAKTGALIRELVTSDSSTNGLSSPTVLDSDQDGDIDYAYAGDLNGKMWKFDLTNSTPGSWPTPTLLYTTNPAQSITMAPALAQHIYGGDMVVFITGRMLMTADVSDTAVHYAYGIWDGAPVANDTILTQTLTAATYLSNGVSIPVRTASMNAPNWSSGAGNHKGWKVALPLAGERVVGDGAFINDKGFLLFTSTNPTITNASPPNGETWLNQISYMTGGSTNSPIYNLNGDAEVDNADRLLNNSSQIITTAAGVAVSKKLRQGLASQPVQVKQTGTLDNTLFLYNPDAIPVAPPTDRGISGGHFDPDIYYGAANKGANPGNVKHYHEYDDTWNVTGVNMLAASSATHNLVNAIPSTATKFKVLVYNQYHSPATLLQVGSGPFVNIASYGGLYTSNTLVLSSLPTYDRSALGSAPTLPITNLQVKWPLDAFQSKDWLSDGNVRAGLVPTQTGCVNKAPNPGPLGEPHNGALTVQIIKDTTPASALIMNVTGRPNLGWRVRDGDGDDAGSVDDRTDYVLAEYTYFWHHPNGACMGAAGWVDNPPQDLVQATGPFPATPAGTSDPKDGDFSGGGSVVSDVTVGNVRTTTYSDGSTRVITVVDNGDGTTTVTTVNCGPGGTGCTTNTQISSNSGSVIGTGGTQVGSAFGRVSWRELF